MYWRSLWFECPAADLSVRGALYLSRMSEEGPMTTLKGVKQAPTAAALKAERERDKVLAVRDYEEENRARQRRNDLGATI